VSGEWSRLEEIAFFTAGQLRCLAAELAAPLDRQHQDCVAERCVFLAADLALAASAALETRYPNRLGARTR